MAQISVKVIIEKVFMDYSMWILLLGVYICIGALIPSLLTPANIQNILVQGVIVGCLSMGMAFVILTGNIDLSMVAIAGFAPLVGIYLMKYFGLPFYLAIVATILIGAGVGLLNGLMVEKLKIPALVQTLITWWVLWGVVLVMTGGEAIPVLSSEWCWIGSAWIGPLRAIVFAYILVIILICILASSTRTGLRFYLTGGNRIAAQAAGINTSRIIIISFIISGIMAATAGYFLSARLGLVTARYAEEWFMPSIAAPVISGFSLTGGRGNFINLIAGAYLVQIIVIAVRLAGLGGWYEMLTQGLLIAAAVLIDVARKKLMRLEY